MAEKGRIRRGNSRFVLFFALILIALSVTSWIGYNSLCQVEWLKIKKIEVAGNENVSAQTIQSLLQDYVGQNLLALDSHEIKKDLYKIKRIARIRTVRLFPSTLKIVVTERKGFLYLLSFEGDLFPVDEQGMIMEYSFAPSKEDMPIVRTAYSNKQLHAGKIIKDAFLNRIFALQKLIRNVQPEFIKSISEYYLQNNLIVIVDARYGTRILLNDQNLDDQLRRYQFVQDNGNIDRSNILDLRFKDQVVVRREVQ